MKLDTLGKQRKKKKPNENTVLDYLKCKSEITAEKTHPRLTRKDLRVNHPGNNKNELQYIEIQGLSVEVTALKIFAQDELYVIKKQLEECRRIGTL